MTAPEKGKRGLVSTVIDGALARVSGLIKKDLAHAVDQTRHKKRSWSAMSKNGESIDEGLDGPKEFVYDFLYCDTRRIGSYLSQFDNSGLLEKVVQRESASKGSKRGYTFIIEGGTPIVRSGGSGMWD